MKTKHTPGTWTFFKRHQDRPDGWVVGDKDAESDVAEGISSRADARLIAAAPELLEALKDAADILSDNPAPQDGGCTHTSGTYRRVLAAIAKAEGRTK